MNNPNVLAHVPSSRDPEVTYVLMLAESGNVLCSCPGFMYRMRCKHVEQWHRDHPGEHVFTFQPRVLKPNDCRTGGPHLFVDLDPPRCWWCKAPWLERIAQLEARFHA